MLIIFKLCIIFCWGEKKSHLDYFPKLFSPVFQPTNSLTSQAKKKRYNGCGTLSSYANACHDVIHWLFNFSFNLFTDLLPVMLSVSLRSALSSRSWRPRCLLSERPREKDDRREREQCLKMRRQPKVKVKHKCLETQTLWNVSKQTVCLLQPIRKEEKEAGSRCSIKSWPTPAARLWNTTEPGETLSVCPHICLSISGHPSHCLSPYRPSFADRKRLGLDRKRPGGNRWVRPSSLSFQWRFQWLTFCSVLQVQEEVKQRRTQALILSFFLLIKLVLNKVVSVLKTWCPHKLDASDSTKAEEDSSCD